LALAPLAKKRRIGTDFKGLWRDTPGRLWGYRYMLSSFATEAIRNCFTLIYRGYDLDVSRAPSGWMVCIYPRSADLPILRQNHLYASDQDSAVVKAKDKIDRALSW
jgi:hypothetical protein